jgi:hypothetical protein
MDVNEVRLGHLFSGDVRFVVPLYQRRYQWSKQNWAALWNDILDAVGRHTATGEEPTYFLGAVVLLSQSVGGPRTLVEREVIDGQQRLATLQVLLNAIRHVAMGRQVDSRYLWLLHRLTRNDDQMAPDPDDAFKLWPTRHDWAAFRAVMAENPHADNNDPHPLVQAHRYFLRAVRAWLGQTPEKARAEAALDGLLTIFTNSLRLVVIDLRPGDNAQVIFESLNTRGLPLQTSDLVRNHFFRLAKAQNRNAERLYEEHWARFEDGFWLQPAGKGPRGATRTDAFLGYFLTMERRTPAPPQELFRTFKEYVAAQTLSLPQVMSRFAMYGDRYRVLEEQVGLDPYERQFMSRLSLLGTASVMPLLLHLFGEYSGEVRRRTLRILESYLIRRVIVGGDAREYASVSAAIIKRLAASPGDPVRALTDQLRSYDGRGTAWPSDTDVRRNVRERNLAKLASWRTRLILSLINAGLHGPMRERVIFEFENLTLEHLMPQSWREHWPLGPRTTAEERDRMIYTLGNLTLITGKLNGALGNSPWVTKRSELSSYSVLPLNQGLPDTWDETAIRARGDRFAEVLLGELPGPGTDAELFAPSDAALDEEAEDLDETAVEDEDETLADELEPEVAVVTGAVPQPAPAPPPSDDPTVLHIYEVLGKHPPGTRLTPGQVSRTASSHFPTRRPGKRAFEALIDSGTLSGIEVTNNQSGHRAIMLTRPPVAARPRR